MSGEGVIRVHRFCSMAEFQRYMEGERLVNRSCHSPRATTSVGFCFFEGNIAEWARRLNGLVDFDALITVDAPRSGLSESRSVYTDWSDDRNPRPAVFHEFSTVSYCRDEFLLVDYDFSFVDRCVSRRVLKDFINF